MTLPQGTGLELVVQTGPPHGRTYPLSAPAGRLFIGRHRICDVVLPTDPQHIMVGRFHAVVASRSAGVFLVNLHPNGTFVNNTLVGEDGEVLLATGDKLQLGENGPVLSLRQFVATPAETQPTAPASVSGPSQSVQSTFSSFSKHLIALYEQMEQAKDESVQPRDVLDGLEVIVTKLASLRAALGLSR